MNRAGALPARYDRVGSWWRADAEVDVVAVADAGALLMGECKWSVNPVGTDVLDRLVGRRYAVVSDLSWVPGNVTYALWSRAGFTKDLQRRAATEGVLLFGLRDILAFLGRCP